MSDISDEMKQSLYTELGQDGTRVYERCMRTQQLPKMDYGEERALLEQLAYITEQMRLKLKILGAPRIYN